ncbi:MAG: arylesterase [Gammaproteobacteria bacterium]|nr:arylesterase [Gammaproteobacteria bacterium]
MRKFLLICVLLFPGILFAKTFKIAILGDSLSAGYGLQEGESWVTLLQKKLNKQEYNADVVNASISGDTSRNGLNRLSSVLARSPDIIIVELGGNDGLRGLSIKEMRQNLKTIIEKSQQIDAKVLLLGMQLPANFGPVYTKMFHQVYFDLASELNVALVPFFMDGVALEKTLMQEDGIHPNAQGQPKLLDNVWPQLEPLLKEEGVS